MRRALLPFLLLWACKGGDDDSSDDGDTGADVDPGPVEFTDVFDQELTSPVDILWVIDSGWVEGNQELTPEVLNSVFETFLLADPNWRMGILDAAAADRNLGIIRNTFETWPATTSWFNLPNPGGPTRVRDAIYRALFLRLELNQNKDFLRSDAHLYVFVYTDKSDASDDISEGDFHNWLSELKPSESKRLSVVTTPGQSNYWSDQLHDGIVVEIDGSFRRAIDEVFLDAMNQRTAFTLTYAPVEPPPLVSVVFREHATEYALGTDFQYDAATRTISFLTAVPPPESQVVVTYTTDDDVVQLPETTTPE